MIIAVGNDHAAVEMKREIVQHLKQLGHTVLDLGAGSTESTDYATYGEAVARTVVEGRAERGVLLCGTGVGISLAANKVRGIRCAVCSEAYTAVLSRLHNDTNVLAMGARVIAPANAISILDAWLAAQFEGGRHQRRIDMITDIENRECSPR